ncbi:hypothetical protein [Colwellia hornerae]|uniref:Lipoprotein n=1 Tax=Colwellia hornerae TaxID=89402 RepID=A0A5C6QHE6_9GAMM|nr:hypothetical protein [Colwellia hornerae]TWX52792.1 hypothetical protein ESZ28_11160 [Colwellia hornerae]TWX59146.1 hypothetical protein ESZ26_10540 [Colwellia hornerae]TWX68173.1 hypothetical protein ESZ27_07475 [Colwellia hornerae]
MKNNLRILLLIPILFACNNNGEVTKIITVGDEVKIAQAVELILLAPTNNITNIIWTQTAGDPVVFLAYTSKVIAFTPNTAGTYSFNVSFTLKDGNKETLSHSISVTDEQGHISARLGHAVLEGSKVSLRASLTSELSADTLVWQQTSGPEVNFTAEDTRGDYAVFFNAPEVTRDTVLEFTASSGSRSDKVAILVENAEAITTSDSTAYTERLARVFPFVADSSYADVLVDCVYSNKINFAQTCTFNTLPLIAHHTTTPTVDDIMDRVIVSHHWMGERFREFLENFDPHNDFKNLLRANTAIVISSDIRPSYYWVVSGAIHLDANYFWQTPDERDTINQAPDYRTSFGSELNFAMPWRYVKNNNYTSTFIAENVRVTRQPTDVLYSLTSLMYHELAHANDIFPSSSWSTLNRNQTILSTAQQIANDTGFKSDQLSNTLPLLGEEMYALAQVRFHGVDASSTEKSYQPNDIKTFFSSEDAPQFYNYSSIREDYAMLFDGFMMKARFDISRDVAITNAPKTANENYIVNWGQRGRIGEANIKPRVLYAVSHILPEVNDIENLVNNLPSPIMMNAGESWADNLNISPIKIEQSALQKISAHRKDRRFIQYEFYEKPSPLK